MSDYQYNNNGLIVTSIIFNKELSALLLFKTYFFIIIENTS